MRVGVRHLTLLTATLLAVLPAFAQQTITTYAGGGPNNLPATQANLPAPAGLAQDSAGNTYVVDSRSYRVFKITPGGTLTVFAGNGLRANTAGEGDGGPAIAAELIGPQAIATDAAGDVFVTDNDRVREIKASDGTIVTYAGSGNAGRGDGGPANQAELFSPLALAVDSAGNLYIGDNFDKRVRRVDAQTLTITTIAGGGVGATPALQTSLPSIESLAMDTDGNLYIGDASLAEVLRMSPDTGAITAVAGSTTGTSLLTTRSGASATSVSLPAYDLAVDSAGNLFLDCIANYNSDESQYSLVEVSAGTVSILAGVGSGGGPLVSPPNDFGGLAVNASMEPIALLVQPNGTLLVSDTNYHYVYTISSGVINAYAGNGTETFAGENVTAPDAALLSVIYPSTYPGIATDAAGNLYYADYRNSRVREVRAADGKIVTVAGTGSSANSGDGSLATQAGVANPSAVALDASGDLYIVQSDRIREVSAATGKIQTVAGGGTNTSEGAPALQASIRPYAVAVDSTGDIFFSDLYGSNVHEVSAATGDVTTYAGGGSFSTGEGDGGPATAAYLQGPAGITFDATGNLYIAEYGEHDNNADNPGAIREVVAKTGVIQTVASGVGNPSSVVLDAAGNMFIADTSENRVWVVPASTGTPELLAGTGALPGDFSGDGGPAIDATLDSPTGQALDGSGNLLVEDYGSLRIRKITNAAGLPIAAVAPTSLSFSAQNVGTGSAVQNVTLTNTGVGNLAISAIAPSGANAADFAVTSSTTCAAGQLLVAGATCTLAISFKPSVVGKESAVLTLTDDASPTTQTIALSGTGIEPGASLTPPSVSFANVTVKQASAPVTVTLNNNGTAELDIASVALSGGQAADFAIASASTCSDTTKLAVSDSCTVQLTFTPSESGSESATLTFTDNADPTTQTVALAGAGILPAVKLSSSSLAFGSQPEKAASAASTITISNSGPGELDFTSFSIGGAFAGDFALVPTATTCSTSTPVAADASCTVAVTFTPSVVSSETATLSLADNAGDTPQTITLSGTGAAAAPVAALSPATLTFASQSQGTTSAAQTITLTNSGSATLAITSIAASGDFAETNTCGSSMDAGKSCTIAVTFTPAAAGARTGTLTVTDNASGSPQTAALTGTGAASAPTATLSPTSLTFASQATASTSAAQTVTLTNSGSAALAITSIAASGDFAETNTCGTSVDAGASCAISVTFSPTVTGTRTGTLTVTDNASASPQTAALTGTGADLSIAAGNGSSTSATVSAGQPATYSLAFTPVNGLSGSFAIACKGAPTAATCIPNPASINLSAGTVQEVTVAITTTARSFVPPAAPARPSSRDWPLALAGLLMLMVLLTAARRRPHLRRLGLAGAGLALAAALAACGGAAAPVVQTPPPSTTPAGTPSGTYTLTITATQGAIVRTQQLTLVVN